METGTILEMFIGALIAVVIGLAFLPTVFTSAAAVTTNANYTKNFASSVDIVQLLPLLFVIIILVGIVAFIKMRKD